ncbi:MAG: hypothetical protein ACK4PR_08245 [Gammaproteobacteria bacterium]
MLENRQQPLLPRSVFILRLARSFAIGLAAIAVALYIGMAGYHYFEGMSWLDAFANAAMILSGMGPLAPVYTTAGKLFAGFYALFSGLSFIFIIGLMFTPVIHRLFHKFHLDN